MSVTVFAASEADWQNTVIDAAKLLGWKVMHSRPSMDRRGHWQTALQGDPGFPDLVLVRDTVLFVELKSNTGKQSKDQVEWMAALTRAGAKFAVWRPRDWTHVQAVLR